MVMSASLRDPNIPLIITRVKLSPMTNGLGMKRSIWQPASRGRGTVSSIKKVDIEFIKVFDAVRLTESASFAMTAEAETFSSPRPTPILPCLWLRVWSSKPSIGAVEIGFRMGPILNEIVWPASITSVASSAWFCSARAISSYVNTVFLRGDTILTTSKSLPGIKKQFTSSCLVFTKPVHFKLS